MRVTVCQMRNLPGDFAADWRGLLEHARQTKPDLVLLPEMCFFPWLAATRQVDPARWREAARAHMEWEKEFPALRAKAVLGSRPVELAGRRLNQAYVWQPGEAARPAHEKYYLPDEAGFWEATWYQPGEPEFLAAPAAGALTGFLICTELWFAERARAYGKQGAHVVACPRATPAGSVDKWLAGGRAAAVVSGAFCLSSNLAGPDGHGGQLGGLGFVAHPEEGDVLAVTSQSEPFVTVEIDLTEAEAAKGTYPRYVKE